MINLLFKTLFFLFFVLSLTFYVSLPTAYAQSATPSASPKPSTSPTPKTVRDALREKVEERLTELSQKPKAYVGTITDIQDSSLILETHRGIRQIKLGSQIVVVQIRDGKTVKSEIKDLGIGNFAAVLGFLETKDVLSARRIIILEELPKPSKKAVYGIVEAGGKNTITIKHPKKDAIWVLQTNSKTMVTKKMDGKIEKTQVSAIEAGDRIVAVGEAVKDKENTLLAKLIHVIPGKAKELLGSPNPSPTAKPSPTP